VVANDRVLITVDVVDLRVVNTFMIVTEHHYCLVHASAESVQSSDLLLGTLKAEVF